MLLESVCAFGHICMCIHVCMTSLHAINTRKAEPSDKTFPKRDRKRENKSKKNNNNAERMKVIKHTQKNTTNQKSKGKTENHITLKIFHKETKIKTKRKYQQIKPAFPPPKSAFLFPQFQKQNHP